MQITILADSASERLLIGAKRKFRATWVDGHWKLRVETPDINRSARLASEIASTRCLPTTNEVERTPLRGSLLWQRHRPAYHRVILSTRHDCLIHLLDRLRRLAAAAGRLDAFTVTGSWTEALT
ncbi:MAG: hypothetical protein ACK4QP_06615 [Pseudorhizobium sp.]